MTTTTSKVDKYFASLPSTVMPLWTQMSKMVPPNPNPSTVPLLWKYDELRPRLMEAGEIVAAEDAERRVLMLVNPRLGPPHTTDTIYGGLQLVLPNEVAPAHRHTAFALRFIIEGTGGFTAVESRKIIMAPGDVILTPSWHWHDHGNEGSDPVFWLDGLNLPIFTRLPVNFAELYQENRYPSELLVTSSPWHFPWKNVEAQFQAENGPHRLHHYLPQGKPLSTTIGAQAEMIVAGHQTSVSQETCSFMYHCYQGHGETSITTPQGEHSVIQWKVRDTFAIPAWSKISHRNLSDQDVAYLFAVNDRPLLQHLDLLRHA